MLFFYSDDVVTKYVSDIVDKAEKKIKKKSIKRQLNIRSKRENDRTKLLLHTLAITENYLNELNDLKIDPKKKEFVRIRLKEFKEYTKECLINESIANLKELKKQRKLPRYIKPILGKTIDEVSAK